MILHDKIINFLVDTGAAISMLKPHLIKDLKQIQRFNEKVEIKGIGNETFSSNEYINFPFTSKYIHKFFLIDLNIPYDGIIGYDLLHRFKATVNTETNEVKLYKPIEENSNQNSLPILLKLDKRSEQIIPVHITNITEGECLIEKTFTKGLLIPSALIMVKNNTSVISCINMNLVDSEIEIPKLTAYPINLKEVEIHHFDNDDELLNRTNKVSQLIRTGHMNTEEQKSIINICKDYKDVFFIEGDTFTFSNVIKHSIDTGDSPPTYSKNYRYPQVHKSEVKSQIRDLLAHKVIRHSHSPYNSPIWIVPKKTDASGKIKWRMVIDYRKLNEVTKGDKYPIPNIIDILDKLGKSKYFSTLDLASGFHQIEVNPTDVEKTAFSTEEGHFEYLRMPFGLKNAPATFQRVMDNVLTGLTDEHCLVYLDDIIVHASSIEEHDVKIRKILKRLRKYNLKLQPDKCEFLRKEVAYLGHIITDKGIKPDPKKITAVQNFPTPKNTKGIKAFLGLVGYYRRFIENFADITKPLTKLLRKNEKFNWSPECENSMSICKNLLTSAPILEYPDFEKEFILTTDASQYALGGILSQGTIGSDKPIAYASRTLNETEQRYSTIERELLAIKWSIQHFRPYLFGRKFTIATDHQPLTWLFSVKDPGSRLVRWRLALEEYDYKIVYKPGKKNQNADALSRPNNIMYTEEDVMSHFNDQLRFGTIEPIDICESQKSIFDNNNENIALFVPCEITTENELWKKLLTYFPNEIKNLKPSLNNTFVLNNRFEDNRTFFLCFNRDKNEDNEKILNFYKSVIDLKIKLIDLNLPVTKIHTCIPSITCNEREYDRDIAKQIFSYVFHSKQIQFEFCEITEQIITPHENMRQKIISYYHDSKFAAHKGIEETIRRIKLKYIWPNLTKDVKEYIKTCDVCQINKIDRRNWSQPCIITTTASKPLERVNIDLIEINEPRKKLYILTMIDELTKYLCAYILKEKSTTDVTRLLLEYCQHLGIPLRIHSDLGAEFVSKAMKKVCETLEIKKTDALTQFPQSNGSIERVHATIKDSMRCLVSNHTPWEIALSISVMTYNNSKHSSTGFTPSELMFGETRDHLRKISTDKTFDFYYKTLSNKLTKLHKLAIETNIKSKERSLARLNSKRKTHEYKIGDYILYCNKRKISTRIKWTGPFKITSVSPRTVTIKLQNNKNLTVSVDHIKPYFKRLLSD